MDIGRRRIFSIAGIYLIISVISLILAYFVFTSQPFQFEFGGLNYTKGPDINYSKMYLGFLYELIRILLLVIVGTSLITTIFYNEILTLFSAKPKSSVSMLYLVICRYLGLFMVVLVFVMLWHHHLVVGPESLMTIWNDHLTHGIIKPITIRSTDYLLYHLPYILYLPYSIIVFIGCGVPLLMLGVYALYSDIYNISLSRKEFQQTVVGETAHSANDIKAALNRFGNKLLDSLSRYQWYALAMTVLVTYEYDFGRYTFTAPGWMYARMGYAISSVMLLSIVISVLIYESAFRRAVSSVDDSEAANDHQFEKEYCVAEFIKRYFRRNVWAFLALVLLVQFSPLADFVTKYFTK
jgi:hypothetical protein